MRPQWYCDALPLIVGGDTGASGPVLRNRMLGLLHGVLSTGCPCRLLRGVGTFHQIQSALSIIGSS